MITVLSHILQQHNTYVLLLETYQYIIHIHSLPKSLPVIISNFVKMERILVCQFDNYILFIPFSIHDRMINLHRVVHISLSLYDIIHL